MRHLALLTAVIAYALGMLGVPQAQAAQRGIYCDGHDEGRLPVLLVHGFNSGPETWSDASRNQLHRAGSGVCIDVFDYAFRSTTWVSDDAIGPALATRISQLATASERGGGAGRVVIVAHSMGGLATRCAADIDCNGGRADVASRIAELVTLGTPNLGSFLAQRPANTLGSLLAGACLYRHAAELDSCDGARAVGSSIASRAFRPGSPEEQTLPDLPVSVPVYALAARIRLISSFFGQNEAELGDVGDLVVLRDSALARGHAVGGLGGTQTIDCGFIDITTYPLSSRSCMHTTLTNDTRFLQAAAHQIALVQERLARRTPSAGEALDAPLPNPQDFLQRFMDAWANGADLSIFATPGILGQFEESADYWVSYGVNWQPECRVSDDFGSCGIYLISPDGGGISYIASYALSDGNLRITGFELLGGGA